MANIMGTLVGKDLIVKYLQSGFGLVRCMGSIGGNTDYGKAKQPIDKNWRTKKFDVEDIMRHQLVGGWVGIIPPKDVICLDVDNEASISWLEKNLGSHPEWVVDKSKNGYHIWFRLQEGMQIKGAPEAECNAGFIVTYRSNKNQIIVPPSDPDNRKWIQGDISQLPVIPYELCRVEKKEKAKEKYSYASVDKASGKLKKFVDEILSAEKGTRNHVINKVAYTVGGLCASGEIGPEDYALEVLRNAALSVMEDDPRNAECAVIGGFNAGKANPFQDVTQYLKATVGNDPTIIFYSPKNYKWEEELQNDIIDSINVLYKPVLKSEKIRFTCHPNKELSNKWISSSSAHIIKDIFAKISLINIDNMSAANVSFKDKISQRLFSWLVTSKNIPVYEERLFYNGKLVTEPFFDGLKYIAPIFENMPRPATCSVNESRLALLDLIKDYKFDMSRKDAEDRFISALLSPYIVSLFHFEHPAIVISADRHGSGKTKLAEIISALSSMNEVSFFPAGSAYDEFVYGIKSLVVQGVRTVIIDNVKKTIGGEALESVMTAKHIDFRAKYEHELSRYQNNTVFIFTLNNAVLTPDMLDRAVLFRILHQEDKAFQDDPIYKVYSHREEYIGHILNILQDWIGSQVRIRSNYRRFADWFSVMQGILGREANLINPAEETMRHGEFERKMFNVLENWYQYEYDFYGLKPMEASKYRSGAFLMEHVDLGSHYNFARNARPISNDLRKVAVEDMEIGSYKVTMRINRHEEIYEFSIKLISDGPKSWDDDESKKSVEDKESKKVVEDVEVKNNKCENIMGMDMKQEEEENFETEDVSDTLNKLNKQTEEKKVDPIPLEQVKKRFLGYEEVIATLDTIDINTVRIHVTLSVILNKMKFKKPLYDIEKEFYEMNKDNINDSIIYLLKLLGEVESEKYIQRRVHGIACGGLTT